MPRITAPAARSLLTIVASLSGTECSSTIEAAVVGIPATSMLSLSRTGSPSSGPRTDPVRRAMSLTRASCNAFGFSDRTALSAGPRRFTAAMRSMYAFVSSTLEISRALSFASSAVAEVVSRSRSSAAEAGWAATANAPTAASAAIRVYI